MIRPYLSDITAYRKGHSAEMTLLTLVEHWKDAIFCQKQIVGVFSTDMSKAFDSLLPQLLRKKNGNKWLNKNAVELVESYFENGKNRVKIG